MKSKRITDRLARVSIVLLIMAGAMALAGCEKAPPIFDGLESAEATDQGVTLAWDAAVDESPPIIYAIYMAESAGGQSFAYPDYITADLSYEVTTLEIGVEYFFIVRARDRWRNEDDNTVELSATPGVPDRLAWSFTSPGPDHIRALDTIHDMDGDDVADILVETDSFELGPADDHLFLLSGSGARGGEVIWSASPSNGTSDSAGWGEDCLDVIRDLSGDGLDDVLLGTAGGNRSAYALDGYTGETLWFYDTHAESGGGWVYDVSPMPDITGDSVPEVLFCAGSDSDKGYLADGASGEIIWRFHGSWDALFATRAMQDIDDDGVPDALFAGGDSYESRIFCVSGASSGSADLIWSHDTGVSNHTMIVIEDIDGDKILDIVVGTWGEGVVCLSGLDGSLIWASPMTYVMRLALLADVNDDGVQDVAVGSWDNAGIVISGLDGVQIWRTPVGTLYGGDVWTIDRVADINGDGVNDVVAGSFDTNIYAFDGTSGEILWSYDTGESRVYAVRGIPDVTGDTVPDVAAGTQALGALGEGTVFLLEGKP